MTLNSYMRPNTPHYVLTLNNSISLGQHLYAASTIRQSCWGWIHTGILRDSLTNADHASSEEVLGRMFATYLEDYEEYIRIGCK